MITKILKSIGVVAVSDVVNRGMLIVFNLVVASRVSESEYGIYTLAISISIYLWVVVDGGLTTLSIRRVAQANEDDRESIAGMTIATRTIMAIVVIGIIGFVLSFLNLEQEEKLAYVLGNIALLSNSLFLAWYARAIDDHVGYLVSYLAVGVMFLGGAIAILIFPSLVVGASEALALRSGMWLLGVIMPFVFIVKRSGLGNIYTKLRVDFTRLLKAYPLGLSALFLGTIPLLPMLSLRYHGMSMELGVYSAAWQIIQVLLAGAAVSHTVFFPMLSSAIAESSDRVNKVLRIQIAGTIVISFILYAAIRTFSDDVIRSVFDLRYEGASIYVEWLSLGVIAILYRYIASTIIVAYGQHKNMVYVTGTVMSIVFIIAFVLGQGRGVYAAIVSYITGEVLVMMGFVIMATRIIRRVTKPVVI